MTRHAELAELSSYLDGELPGGRQQQLEDHVRACARCRDRLTGLEQMMARLRDVGRESPPNELAGHVHHRLALEHRRPSRLRAIEQWLAQWRPAPALIAGAALVVALAAIVQIYLSGNAVMRERETAPETRAPQAEPASPTMMEGVEESAEPRRHFQLHEGAWVQEGAGGAEPDRQLTWEQARAEGLLDALPELTRFRDSDRPVIVRHRGEVIRVVPQR